MEIVALAAVANNGGIGINNTLPWYLPSDLKNFKKITDGSPIIMGRNTYNSIGKPLKNRVSIVLTNKITEEDKVLMLNYNNNQDLVTSIYFFTNMFDVIDFLNNITSLHKKAFLIGGASLYKKYLNICSELIITKVLADVKCDTFFPEIDSDNFSLVSTCHDSIQEQGDEYPYIIKIYNKNK